MWVRSMPWLGVIEPTVKPAGSSVIDADVGGLGRPAVCDRDGEGDRIAFIGSSVVNRLSNNQIGCVTDRERLTGIIGGGVAVGLIQGDVGDRVSDGRPGGSGINISYDG